MDIQQQREEMVSQSEGRCRCRLDFGSSTIVLTTQRGTDRMCGYYYSFRARVCVASCGMDEMWPSRTPPENSIKIAARRDVNRTLHLREHIRRPKQK